MPSSHFYQMDVIAELLTLSEPKAVLDVGVGFGKYGVLAREFLDIYTEERYFRKDWKIRIDGVEAFKDYITPLHEFIYDHIYIGNALVTLPTIDRRYDLILLVDVLEHFSPSDGSALLQRCREKAANVIVSTPKRFLEQGSVFGNAFEEHKSQWTESDFAAFPDTFFVYNKVSLICYMGEKAGVVRRELGRRRNILEKTLILFSRLWDRVSVRKMRDVKTPAGPAA